MEKSKKHIKISALRKNVNFQIPDGYFDQLPYAIQEKVQRKRTLWKRINELPLGLKLTPAYFIVAIVLVFLWEAPSNAPQDFNEILSEVTYLELADYLFYENITTYEIANSIESYDSITFEHSSAQDWIDELSNDELKNLLNSYDYDTSIQYY